MLGHFHRFLEKGKYLFNFLSIKKENVNRYNLTQA